MDINPTLALARDLAKAVIARKALIADGAPLTDFMVMALDKLMAILADDLQAAIDAPQSFKAWTPHNPRNTYNPGGAL